MRPIPTHSTASVLAERPDLASVRAVLAGTVCLWPGRRRKKHSRIDLGD